MDVDRDELKWGIEVKRRQSFTRRQIELGLWLFMGLFISGRVWFELITFVATPSEIFSMRYFEILGGILAVIFPVLYSLIFGALPLENIRRGREERKLYALREHSRVEASPDTNSSSREYNLDELITKETIAESPEDYFANLVLGSRKLARGLYSRSGVYLMIGVLIAFSGLGFFYLQTSALLSEKNSASLLISLAPNFGILFFIEFIALFFLKQYRSAMDEFRYYESLQRSREETLAIIKMLKESENSSSVFEMIEKTGFRSTSEKLDNGQTTDLIESKKLNKDEAEIFMKLIDVLGKR